MDVAIGLGEERSGRRREKRKKGRSTLRKKQKRRGRRKWKEQETRPTGGTGEVIDDDELMLNVLRCHLTY